MTNSAKLRRFCFPRLRNTFCWSFLHVHFTVLIVIPSLWQITVRQRKTLYESLSIYPLSCVYFTHEVMTSFSREMTWFLKVGGAITQRAVNGDKHKDQKNLCSLFLFPFPLCPRFSRVAASSFARSIARYATCYALKKLGKERDCSQSMLNSELCVSLTVSRSEYFQF